MSSIVECGYREMFGQYLALERRFMSSIVESEYREMFGPQIHASPLPYIEVAITRTHDPHLSNGQRLPPSGGQSGATCCGRPSALPPPIQTLEMKIKD